MKQQKAITGAPQLTGTQQRPIMALMSRSELREAIDEILSAGVEADRNGEPNASQLRKASMLADELFALTIQYAGR